MKYKYYWCPSEHSRYNDVVIKLNFDSSSDNWYRTQNLCNEDQRFTGILEQFDAIEISREKANAICKDWYFINSISKDM